MPDNLIAKPTLMWLVASKQARQTVEVSYLAQNLSWNADYVLVINEQDTIGALQGWVTLSNQSGTSYRNAELKLVAGDVNRVRPQSGLKSARVMETAAAAAAPGFSEQALFEYHLYTLGRPTTVLNNEQKQVSLLEAENIKIDKKLIFYGQQYWPRSVRADSVEPEGRRLSRLQERREEQARHAAAQRHHQGLQGGQERRQAVRR